MNIDIENGKLNITVDWRRACLNEPKSRPPHFTCQGSPGTHISYPFDRGEQNPDQEGLHPSPGLYDLTNWPVNSSIPGKAFTHRREPETPQHDSGRAGVEDNYRMAPYAHGHAVQM